MVVTLRKTKQDETANEETKDIQLTKEELAMLYEEPELITTNALKAVSGHVAQDERRICPFYDPKTGACFKGNSCHLLHMPMLQGI